MYLVLLIEGSRSEPAIEACCVCKGDGSTKCLEVLHRSAVFSIFVVTICGTIEKINWHGLHADMVRPVLH